MKRGFTLIELLVVIAIIGILSSVVLASLNTARLKSRDTRRVADIKQLQIALALYYDANSSYPSTLSALSPTYISVISTDPSGASWTGTTGGAYAYSALGTGSSCSSYHLGAALEDTGNQALNSDGDFSSGSACTGSLSDFDGNASKCVGTTATTPDSCYDVKP